MLSTRIVRNYIITFSIVIFSMLKVSASTKTNVDSLRLSKQLNDILNSELNDQNIKEVERIYISSKKSNFKEIEAEALRLKGKYELTRSNRYDKATSYLIQSLAIYDSLKNYNGSASCNLQLGIISYDIQNYYEAIQYFKTVINKANKNHQIRATANYLMALSYSEIDSFNKAIYLFDYTIKEYTKLNYEDGIRMCKQFIGKMYVNTKNYKKAIKYLRVLTDIAKNKKDSTYNVPAYAFLSTGYLKINDYSNSIKYGEYAHFYAQKEHGSTIYIKEAYNNLHVAYSKIGNSAKAYYFLNKLNSFKDSLYNNAIIEGISKTKSQYEYEQQLKIEKIEQEKKDLISQQELKRQKFLRNSFIIGFIIVGLFSLVFLFQRNNINKEKKRSEQLLLNILPFDVAEELKEKGKADAKLFEQVSVLFTDFKGFTEISAKMSASELVAEINECFTEFDKIMQKYNIEKIKTIGDSYMAVGGLPNANTTHAKDVVKAAMEIHRFINNLNSKKAELNKAIFEIRIGIHSGPVVAGIVGLNKFSYDVWGDTVNTASRMERNSETGMINISSDTYNLIKDEYACTYRGKFSVKGKGEIDMYYLNV